MIQSASLQERTDEVQVHLQYIPPTLKYSFEDLGLQKPPTATAIAATNPFPFLSLEGVRAYRKAISSVEILKNCSFSPYKNTLVLRNVAKYSTFIRELWTHPTTLRLFEEIAGVPLVPAIPYEIGQTNLQVRGSSVEEMVQELSVEPSTAVHELTDEEKSFDPLTANSIIPWHYDSYPYVLVVMLSSTVGMHGGETYLKKGDCTALKVEGPSLGHCVFLQGGEVQHLAARAIGVDERIATITSLRAEVPGLYDSSYLTNVRPVSHRPEIYGQWVQYRLNKLQSEISSLQFSLDCSGTEDPVDTAAISRFAESQIAYLWRTADQLVDYGLHNRIMDRFGQDAYYAAAECWDQIQEDPSFSEVLGNSDDGNSLPGSHLWADLSTSREAIRSGQILPGQLGEIKWEKKRLYVMGDELFRQGLREAFFDWLTVTGLDHLQVRTQNRQ